MWNNQVPTTSFHIREMATDHACKAFCRLVLFSLLTHHAQATAVVHMALEQIFQRNSTWGHSAVVPPSPALQGQGTEKILMPLQPSASHSSILIQQCHVQAYKLWLWLRQPHRKKHNFLLRPGLYLAEDRQTHSTDTSPQKGENGQVKHRAA